MKVLKIKKSGKLILEENIGEKITIEKIKSIKECLACEVILEKGLTFGTFFKLILKEKEFFDIVFSQELKGKKLKDFEDKLNDKPEIYEEDFKIDFLEISKLFEFFTFDAINTIDLFPVFIGMGKTIDGFDVFIPLSFCSVNELRDLEIVPNKIVEVYREMYYSDPDEEMDDDDDDFEPSFETESGCENCDHDCNGGECDIFPYIEAATRISLYEAIQGIIHEIAYYKTDEERIKIRRSQDNEQNNKNKIQILENRMKKHIEDDEYEKAASVKREIDRIKTILNTTKP